ncbi:flagellar biosynthetic protein FliQ [Natronospira proteinivora]|uniref:Flagellar biosynthetic protein FliQ n=1 Tax=Natronospira proteinivora TaxID=1807133 RepID=A0ABT1G5T3_9GAMM|nr:flagellar biosynthesis protein FliQ [Natronospira proteinivora]MCP1726447.1 flagellar biosynthetic protein FliQ [Natronospira proteinivora]
MSPELAVTIGQEALKVTAMVAAPLLVSALAMGLLVGMFQAATQINEMTLSFIPKLLVLVLSLGFFSSWMLSTLMDFTVRLIRSIPLILGGG